MRRKLQELKDELNECSLIRNRNASVTPIEEDGTEGLVVKEHGNPAIEINGTSIEKTGRESLPNRVQTIADRILGTHEYKCSVYADNTQSRTKIEI